MSILDEIAFKTSYSYLKVKKSGFNFKAKLTKNSVHELFLYRNMKHCIASCVRNKGFQGSNHPLTP